MRINYVRMLRWASEGEYVLERAAAQEGRTALELAAHLQTEIAFAMMIAACIYFLWRGYSNPRLSGWSDFFWIAGVGLIFFTPRLAPGLTAQRVDHFLSSWVEFADPRRGENLEHIVPPTASLIARALEATFVAGFLALCAHDIAHRLRQALWEFGLLAEDERMSLGARRSNAGRFKTAREGFGAANAGESEADHGDRGGFGHRDFARATPASPRAEACATLGVWPGASRAEIERAYRTKMKRAHPDHGGSAAQAAALNLARELLLPHEMS